MILAAVCFSIFCVNTQPVQWHWCKLSVEQNRSYDPPKWFANKRDDGAWWRCTGATELR